MLLFTVEYLGKEIVLDFEVLIITYPGLFDIEDFSLDIQVKLYASTALKRSCYIYRTRWKIES